MVDKSVPALPPATLPLVGDELAEVVQLGNSRQAPVSALGLGEAISDGNAYGRLNGMWVTVVTTAMYTAADILTKIKTVDGTGSGLDADQFDGHEAAYFAVQADLIIVAASDALKAPIASPVLTGDPKAPTPAPGDNDTSIATTAFVTSAVVASDAIQTAALALKAPIASPTFTGDPKAPTPLTADSDTSIATTAFVHGITDALAPLADPIFTGNPRAPNQIVSDSDTSIATTAFVHAITDVLAPIASPIFTGDAKAVTQAPGDNDTSIATTAYVTAADTVLKGYVDSQDALKAPIASPVFTGNPTAPTPATLDNDTSIATTAYVQANASPAAILAKLETVDGVGSGLDADELGGFPSTAYALLASPAFVGLPTAPTPLAGDNDTSIATTAFVKVQGYLTDAASDGVTYGRKNNAWAATASGLPEAPNDGSAYVRQGLAWVASGKMIERFYTTSATWNKPAGLRGLFVKGVAPGGGGGGASATTGANSDAGGGAGAGALGEKYFDAASLPASIAMTIGAIGVGSVGTNGSPGGTCLFGALATITGGAPGTHPGVQTSQAPAQGGLGGVATGWTIDGTGASGSIGIAAFGSIATAWAGKGADSPYGTGGPDNFSIFVAGVDAAGFGAGGSGSANGASRSAKAGGNGAPGFFHLVEVY